MIFSSEDFFVACIEIGIKFRWYFVKFHSMGKSVKLKETKSTIEIKWNIRELFSESSLTSFLNEIEDQYLIIEKQIKS
tara:strand:- start:548 stop:781 length:234 start_codon:yes stop_codon:yes gene_type:complete